METINTNYKEGYKIHWNIYDRDNKSSHTIIIEKAMKNGAFKVTEKSTFHDVPNYDYFTDITTEYYTVQELKEIEDRYNTKEEK